MAVAPERILSEIEKYASRARTENPAKMRESVAAIRALCNLILDEDGNAQDQKPRAMPLASPASKPQIMLGENKLKEEDANGDSLFDF
ncbi:YwdI family protein [Planomicrobium sp. CPCC 101079]|uniref:YwdI family protein n=1 Tax=Planomicrobium sp. CPCC 101079 TaxID=2599618 RepID=UPI0011B3D4F1|nr:YwdI family protein [Planomicrobium sp. CPCC 101079]TWT03473.1 hypothetical protein FQV28_10645 [Planomicrobium sp. CPCC 101079]